MISEIAVMYGVQAMLVEYQIVQELVESKPSL